MQVRSNCRRLRRWRRRSGSQSRSRRHAAAMRRPGASADTVGSGQRRGASEGGNVMLRRKQWHELTREQQDVPCARLRTRIHQLLEDKHASARGSCWTDRDEQILEAYEAALRLLREPRKGERDG